jgi:hypothetical protein
MLPEYVSKAAILASLQEHLLGSTKKTTRFFKGSAPVLKPDTKATSSTTEVWQARQKEYHRANGLRYKCGKKFSPDHKCSTAIAGVSTAQVAVMVTEFSDGGGVIPNDILNLLESVDRNFGDSESYLSLHALAGTQSSKAIHLMALINNQVLSILVDSGSSRTFLNESMVHKLQIVTRPFQPMSVKVAIGQQIQTNKEVPALTWWIQGYTFSTSARILELGANDLILGMDWLEDHSPMQCDWLQKRISFLHENKMITLQGVVHKLVEQITEISAEQLSKLQKGNDRWALVILSQLANNSTHQERYSSTELLAQIKELIHEHQELFKTPEELPPNRTYDHSISLLPYVIPVNCRPYRYSPPAKGQN